MSAKTSTKKSPGELPANATIVAEGQAFNPVAHIHYLLIDGAWVRVPGVSSISKVCEWDSADRLMGWAVKQQALYLTENLQFRDGKPIILDPDGAEISFTPENVAALIRVAKGKHKEEKEAAGDLGSRIHRLIELYLKTGKMPETILPDEQPAWCAWMEWHDEHRPEVFLSEMHVGSRRHLFAGIIDIGAVIGGTKYLLDIKTSGGFYPSHLVQVGGGYSIAYEETVGDPIEHALILRLDKKTGIPYPLDISPVMENCKALFLLCREIYSGRKPLEAIITNGGGK